MSRGLFFSLAMAVLVLGTVGTAEAARGKPNGPDLVVRKAPTPAAVVQRNVSFRLHNVVKNQGSRRARRTVVRYYLSLDKKRNKGDMRLVGRRGVRALKAGKVSKGKGLVRVPAPVALGRYRLIACADDRRQVRERDERNNCRASRVFQVGMPAEQLPSPGDTEPAPQPQPDPAPTPEPLPDPGPTGPPDTDGDGTPDEADCQPQNPDAHPGAADDPDSGQADTNCDGIDGTAEQALFVSTLGSDTSPGTRQQPKRTVNDAVQAAAAAGKDVYVTVGTYDETLDVGNGVSVFGGYDTDWDRSASGVTRLAGPQNPTGSTLAATAIGIDTPTTLQQLTLAPRAPSGEGLNSYGLRVSGSSALTLDRVIAIGARATAGRFGTSGTPGALGGAGKPCTNGYDGGAGGSSAAGRPGGRGGRAGGSGDYTGWGYISGEAGVNGSTWGAGGGQGGPGGEAGDPAQLGGDGLAGRDGLPGADGSGASGGSPGFSWSTRSGLSGAAGGHGHGGGGGGGGGTDTDGVDTEGRGGGGGGGGGQGGGAGQAGQGGGGSFGIYVSGSPGVVIKNSQLTASDAGSGGAGGRGAAGAGGGTGGAGCPTDDGEFGWGAGGGNGAPGGDGAAGGDGGGGAGGPSIALYKHESTVTGENNTFSFGTAGAGGAGGNGKANLAGTTGLAANTNPPPKPKPDPVF